MRATACFFVLLAIVSTGCPDGQKDPPPTPTPPLSPSTGPSSTGGPKGAPLQGKIKGQAFVPDLVVLEGGELQFRKGKDFFAEMEIRFKLLDAKGKLEPKEWTFTGDKFENPTLTVGAKQAKGDSFPKSDFVFPKDYTLKLAITKVESRSFEGTIELEITKPAQTSLVGAFKGEIKKTAAEPLDKDDAPYVDGIVTILGDWKEVSLSAGFAGLGKDGKSYSNGAGSSFSATGGGWVISTTFKPQITSVVNLDKGRLAFKHTQLKPGEYWFYVKRNDVVATGKLLEIKEGDELKLEFTIDPSKSGTLVVNIPEAEANETFESNLQVIPEGLKIPGDNLYFFDSVPVKKGQMQAKVAEVPVGKYRVVRGRSEGTVEVMEGKESTVTLERKE